MNAVALPFGPLPPMRVILRIAVFALILTACASIVGETPVETVSGGARGTIPGSATTASTERGCVQHTGGATAVSTGSVAGDALFLSGEIFVCADSVVVVGEGDLNEVAAGAQLAAALGGPLLLPHPQLAAELGRLKPQRVYVLGEIDLVAPPNSVVSSISITEAVDLVTETLSVTVDVRLPSAPNESTVIETVKAIAERSHAVLPQTSPSDTTIPPDLDSARIVSGLAVPTVSESVWLVDAADPVTILLASANGRSIGASVIAYDPDDVLGYPEVGDAIAGRPPGAIRYVGSAPEVDEWEIAVLANGVQVPGGGFRILPEDQARRYVAFYGHPVTSALGALGEQPPPSTWTRMQPFLADYAGDGARVIPTFEMIASVASASATDDGDFSYEWPIETFDEYIDLAKEKDGYVILDLQSGRDDFLSQAKQYEELLKLPFVGLAVDPEWRLKPDQVHLRQTGTVTAAEINEVVDWLADLVRENALPQKIIMVQQFRESMIQNRDDLKERPELQMIIQMDGDGSEASKDATYARLTAGTENAHWSWGWKNFFDEDEPGPPSPENTMGKDPVPVFVSYQ